MFELKFAASFTFNKFRGSSPVEGPELAGLLKIHGIFTEEVAPLVRQRWFSWDKVELPREMMKTPGILSLSLNLATVGKSRRFRNFKMSSSFSLLSTTNTSTSWSPSSENLTFDNPKLCVHSNIATAQSRDFFKNEAFEATHYREAFDAEKESLVIRPRSLRVAKLLDISPRLQPPPFIVAARPDQQSSTATEPTVPNSKVTGHSKSHHGHTANSVQMQTTMRSVQTGLS
ncbi:hypothetical protein EV424DRAFT_1356294, partial [Suillus variegatus]